MIILVKWHHFVHLERSAVPLLKNLVLMFLQESAGGQPFPQAEDNILRGKPFLGAKDDTVFWMANIFHYAHYGESDIFGLAG